jgi:type II secretory pathway pseudopilin PulG
MAVLAATIIPQFSSSTNDAKVSTAQFNLFTMRSQMQLYMLHHLGATPTGQNNLNQFTMPTDVNGNVSTTQIASTSFPYGPYCQTIPVNPFTNSNTITVFSGSGTPTPTGSGGWIYQPTTGSFWIDNTTYFSQL